MLYYQDMSGEYDKIIKETISDISDVLISKVLGINVVESTPLETKLQITDEREADFILNVTTVEGENFVLHIEFQSTNDAGMAYRMMRYWLYITQIHKLPIV